MPFLHADFKTSRLVWLLALTTAADPIHAEELELSASPSGLVGGSAEVGAPLLVTVRLDVPANVNEPVALAGAPADWRQAVTVQLIRSSDDVEVARAQPVGPAPDPVAQVEPTIGLSGRWLFAADSLASAAAGDYVLRARMDGGTSEPLVTTWRLAFVPPQTSADYAVQRTLGAALAAGLAGEVARARTLLNEALRAEPNRYELLIARAQLALSESDLRAASFCLRRAAAVVARGSGERPTSLHLLTEQLRALSMERGTDRATSPEIDLPPALLVPLATTATTTASGVAPSVSNGPESGPARKGVGVTSPPAGFVLAGAGTQTSSSPAVHAASAPASGPAPAPAPASHPKAPAAEKSAPLSASTTSPTNAAPTNAAPSNPAPSNAVPAAAGPGNAGRPADAGPGKHVLSAELTDANVTSNPRGRWAADAKASGSYGKVQYGPQQATGAPNISVAGNSPNAWCTSRQTGGEEWLEVIFGDAAAATGVRIRQNNAPGAICRVEAIDDSGATHLWWAGRDPLPRAAVRQITWFGIDVPATDYRVARLRITLDLNAVPDWKEIDAVQLVTTGP